MSRGLGVDQSVIARDMQNFDTELMHSGHTPAEIGERLGVSERTVRDDTGKDSQLGKIAGDLGMGWNRISEIIENSQLGKIDCRVALYRLSRAALFDDSREVEGVTATGINRY